MAALATLEMYAHVHLRGLVLDVQHVSYTNRNEIDWNLLVAFFSGLLIRMLQWWLVFKPRSLYLYITMDRFIMHYTYV